MKPKMASQKPEINPTSPLVLREKHYERHFGPLCDQVARPVAKKPVHVDIYQVMPDDKRPYWTLVTGGMSDVPQNIPAPIKEAVASRAELLLYATEPKRWMFDLLDILAEFPSRSDTYLHWHHTWTNDAPLTPAARELTSCLFLPPRLESPSINNLLIGGDRVNFLWALPITESERSHAVSHGGEVLEEMLVKSGLDLVDYEGRKSVV